MTNLTNFDASKYKLGDLCRKGHDYCFTNQSLRYIRQHRQGECCLCANEKARKQRPLKKEVIQYNVIPGEVWLPVPEYEDYYEVSDLGRIRVLRTYTGKLKEVPTIKRLTKNCKTGYPSAVFKRGGRIRGWTVHTLVLTVFVGMRPANYVCAHLNGNKTDNRLINLSWTTPCENAQHKFLHGTQPQGINHHWSKLTDSEVIEIKTLLAKGVFQKDIAKMFNISTGSIGAIALGRTWKHITLEAHV